MALTFGRDGRKLYKELTAMFEFETVAEREVLEMACRSKDDLARLEGLLAKGAATLDPDQQVKLLREIRASRSAFERLISALRVPAPPGVKVHETPTARHASVAATARWRQVREQRERDGLPGSNK